jgi:hypothetical protein
VSAVAAGRVGAGTVGAGTGGAGSGGAGSGGAGPRANACAPDRWYGSARLGGLRRFAAAITLLNVLGHTWLGFEQAWIQPVLSVLTAYAVEFALELADARARRRPLRFAGGLGRVIDFLLPAHITGLAVGMLLYANAELAPIVFAAALAIASKSVLRMQVDGGERHVMNPSNFGIACTLLLFPRVGIAAPYMFTENLGPVGDWVFVGVIVSAGTFLNARFTRRLPLIGTWLAAFVLQGALRSVAFEQPFVATLLPMTGMAFLLFTFYMATDPPTTPASARGQMVFGATLAGLYGLLMALHVVFGLFFALALTSLGRALGLALAARRATRRATRGAASLPLDPARLPAGPTPLLPRS